MEGTRPLIVFETAQSDGYSMSIAGEVMYEDETYVSDGSELGYQSPDTSLVIFETKGRSTTKEGGCWNSAW